MKRLAPKRVPVDRATIQAAAAEVDPIREADFGRRLGALKGRISRELYWSTFLEAFPHRPRGAEIRVWLLRALWNAEDLGIIRIPPSHGKCWDDGYEPAIPLYVDRTKPPKRADEDAWKAFPWHPRLAWVRTVKTLRSSELKFLERVHNGLRDGEFAEIVPLKHRSIQLTDDEKRLGQLSKGQLFAADRLSLELLGCSPEDPLPVAMRRVGDAPAVLVVENVGAFSVARQALESLPRPPYGLIVWGSGVAFKQSVRQLAHPEHRITSIHYVGDLDRPGLSIAAAAAAAAQDAGLPPLEPAAGVHRAMLDAASRKGFPEGMEYPKGQKERGSASDDQLVDWLPADVRDHALRIFRLGRRVPEEILIPKDLRALWS
jgi:hypothetical protein